MTYAAQIVGPSGQVTYLSRGKRVGYEHATHYPHPSSARRAVDAFQAKHKGFIGIVIKPSDPEWQEP